MKGLMVVSSTYFIKRRNKKDRAILMRIDLWCARWQMWFFSASRALMMDVLCLF